MSCKLPAPIQSCLQESWLPCCREGMYPLKSIHFHTGNIAIFMLMNKTGDHFWNIFNLVLCLIFFN